MNPIAANYKLVSNFVPAGDQPQAIQQLTNNLHAGVKYQTLLGITGSGKTFTIANVIKNVQKPTLVVAHNKTLAAQLYTEFRDFFPENRVRYFVSYYDYYQPEAYIPSTDTYIEKDSAINEEIDKMRHSATRAVLEARDSIIVASVSCIYGLGAPEDYFKMMLYLEKGQTISRADLLKQLVLMQYERSDIKFERGVFRVRGESIDIFPSDEDEVACRIIMFGDEIEELQLIDSITGKSLKQVTHLAIYPLSHFVTSPERVKQGVKSIKTELNAWLPKLRNDGKAFEAERLSQRTLYDLELFNEIGFCPGVENYSRHLDHRNPGEPPKTLLDYFPKDFLLVIDESHVSLPQLRGMYRGDQSRKQTLVDHGFRLPSALDNRPLKFEEFWSRINQAIFVSATPGNFELEISSKYLIEQLNRPTGLLDPEIILRPAINQVEDLILEVKKASNDKQRILVTTLTKKMAEDLSLYFREIGIKSRYLHSDIKTIERIDLLNGLRKGDFDVLIGINLLREGLDLIEVGLVAILDADKEGFLRSTTSLVQTIGRAARNIHGRAILYADNMTKSIKEAVSETNRRREVQIEYNKKHGIVPKSAEKAIIETFAVNTLVDLSQLKIGEQVINLPKDPKETQRLVEKLKKDMFEAAANRKFEKAAELRDVIKKIQEALIKT